MAEAGTGVHSEPVDPDSDPGADAGTDVADADAVGADVVGAGLVGSAGTQLSSKPRRQGQGQGPVLAVVASGGAIGACARYGAGLIWPTAAGHFPWTTFGINVLGCAVIGVFMVVITDVWAAHRLVRPFFGTGVLGGFTTFSTYTVDIQKLVDGGHAATGLAYLAATMVAALAAVWLAATSTRRVIGWRRR